MSSTTRPTFANAVRSIPSISSAYQDGIQALSASEKSAVRIADTRSLAGSVDLDHALEQQYPNDARWDYGVGVSGASRDRVVWLEFHPANSHSVSEVVQKSKWLQKWLKADGAPLRDLSGEKLDLRWVPTGRVSIRRGSSEQRKLATAGVGFPSREVVLG